MSGLNVTTTLDGKFMLLNVTVLDWKSLKGDDMSLCDIFFRV
jgi:hypothetical protein